MQNALIYNDLWKDVCNGDKPPTNPIDAKELARCELKDENSLTLLKYSVTNGMLVHVENAIDAWNA